MKATVLLLIVCSAAFAQSPVNPRTVESRSKQFVVRAGRAFDAFIPRITDGRTIDLDPTLVGVSAERIKSLLLRELRLADTRQNGIASAPGKIYILLQEARSPEIVAEALKTPLGWSYRLEIPRQIDPPRLVEAIVVTLLLDLVNRGNPGERPEIPLWLKRGMTEHLQALSMDGLVLQQDQKTSKVKLKVDPLASPRAVFSKHQPLTFNELSWPDRLDSGKADVFAPSAHLLVHYLLAREDGPGGMVKFLNLLKHRKNWQTALMESFPGWETTVDVEKWWAVTMVQFTAVDPAFAWPRATALQQMENALRVPIQVRSATQRLPVNSTADLSTVILSWDNLRQEMGLQTVLKQLRAIRPRLPSDLVDLDDDYCALIENYLSLQASRNLGSRTLTQSSALQKKKTAQTIQELNVRLAEITRMPLASAREEAIQRALEAVQPKR